MLKSTYKPSAALAPLLPGWTEHTAPSGHKYYYHAETKQSTYTRPVAGASIYPQAPPASGIQYQSNVSLADPANANAFLRQYNPSHQARPQHGPRDGTGKESRPKPQPTDKPRSKVAIPGCEPWVLVYTKYGRRFVYNPDKNASYWRIPDKLKDAILELDKARIRQKAGGAAPEPETTDTKTPGAKDDADAARAADAAGSRDNYGDDSDEYEEIEVTDSEGESGEDVDQEERGSEEGPDRKRARTEEPRADTEESSPKMSEEEHMAQRMEQLAAEDEDEMARQMEAAQAAIASLTPEDAKALFTDLLADFHINPYSPFEAVLENKELVADLRWGVFSSQAAKKKAWEEWSRDAIRELKEQRAKPEKNDPRIQFMEFLQQKATLKLYWPEFKRKYRKEPPMKDGAIADKDREKWYRELINRRKLPESTLKEDFMTLLRSLPLTVLNRYTMVSQLPTQILVDMRYVSLDPKVRESLLEAHIRTLAPPPNPEAAEEDEARKREAELRRRREDALRKRQQAVDEERRRIEREMRQSKAALRKAERELERAMQVDRRGLKSQLEEDMASQS